jgi:predicted nucleic acid-binding protein
MMKILLDANILYPSSLRDLFFELSRTGCFELYWSEKILNEWIKSIQHKLNKNQKIGLDNILQKTQLEFSSSVVDGYEGLLKSENNLPDKDDIHVVEAAIKAKVDYIVTFNTRDFTNSLLKKYGIRAVHPDRLISDLIQLKKINARQAIDRICQTEIYNGIGYEKYCLLLKNRGMIRTVRYLA